MRVMLVNITLGGHHLDYVKALCCIVGIEPIVVLRETTDKITSKQVVLSNCVFGSMKLRDHIKWINKFKKIIKQEKPDVIHFIWGDSFYRFFGVGFWNICKKSRCYITFHQVRKTVLHNISIRIYSKMFRNIIVHTDSLLSYLHKLKIKNVVHIEYPNFRQVIKIDSEVAKNKLNIKSKAPILLSLGGTRYDKGLDILLEALNKVKEPFFFLIAGAEQNIKRDIIIKMSRAYVNRVKLILRYLTPEELDYCLSAADYIILPYRKTFDGASGPLAEGVGYGKCIIGSNHNSLGKLIREHHIGFTFESENSIELANVLNCVLKKKFVYDKVAKNYQDLINVENFKKAHYKVYCEEVKIISE